MEHDEQYDFVYKVVVNEEEQYSIMIDKRENALGWRDEGMTGKKDDCLRYIEKIWTDMRPLTLQKHMAKKENELLNCTIENNNISNLT